MLRMRAVRILFSSKVDVALHIEHNLLRLLFFGTHEKKGLGDENAGDDDDCNEREGDCLARGRRGERNGCDSSSGECRATRS